MEILQNRYSDTRDSLDFVTPSFFQVEVSFDGIAVCAQLVGVESSEDDDQ